jgi:hypothetical protein
MTEKSYWWTTGGAGDGSAEYTRSDHQWITWSTSACFGGDGVGPTFLNALSGSVPGANTARIATGVAIVDGKPYKSDANVDVSIPSAVGGGNTRIDRVVLRADWTAQTVRITRISGTDAGSPVAPALTQTSGTTWDTPLYQALVDTAGTVTLTDERQMAKIDTGDISLLAITSALIGPNAVIAGKLADGAVDTTARMANDIVDDTKVGNRVPQFYRRQGGDATDWSVSGTTTYTPGAVRMQSGAVAMALVATFAVSVDVTFPVAFAAKPGVQVAIGNTSNRLMVAYSNVTASGFRIEVRSDSGATVTETIQASWLAYSTE